MTVTPCETVVRLAMSSGKWMTPAEIQWYGVTYHKAMHSDSSITRRIREYRYEVGADNLLKRMREGSRAYEYMRVMK